MNGHDHYENTWKFVQMMNQERLEEANRIHLAKLAQQSEPRNTTESALNLSPFSRFLYQATITISAILWSIL